MSISFFLKKNWEKPFAHWAVVFAATVSMAWPGAGSASAVPVQEVRSKSGLSAWLVEDHTLPLIAVQFSFAGGSAADPPGKQGVAYLLSGMLDEGAGDLDSKAFQERVDDLAVKLSFESGVDDFTVSFQTLEKNKKEAFGLLKTALHHPRFDLEPLEKVRHQIEVMIRRDEEDPDTLGHQAWMDLAFQGHPYRQREKGTLTTLSHLSAEDLRALHRRLFARDGLKISVVGAMTREELTSVLDDLFGDLPEKSGMPAIGEARLPEFFSQKVIEHDIPQTMITFGFSGIKRDDPDFIPAYVMNFVLGDGGFGSRLMEEVREKRGLTYGISTGFYPLKKGAFFMGSFSTMNEKAKDALALVTAELSKMAAHGPTQAELDEAKSYLTGSFPLRFDSNRKIVAQLNGFQRQDLDITYVNRRNALISAVTLEETKRVAARLLHPDHLLVTLVGRPVGVPQETPKDGTVKDGTIK